MFFATEEHSTITPCTLPDWLPRDIIEKMVVEFGSRLRMELVKLQNNTEVLRCRTSSTDTRRISLDSVAGLVKQIDDDEILDMAFQDEL